MTGAGHGPLANFFAVVVTSFPSTLFRFSMVATTTPALRPMLPTMRMTRLAVIGVPVFNPSSLNTLPDPLGFRGFHHEVVEVFRHGQPLITPGLLRLPRRSERPGCRPVKSTAKGASSSQRRAKDSSNRKPAKVQSPQVANPCCRILRPGLGDRGYHPVKLFPGNRPCPCPSGLGNDHLRDAGQEPLVNRP